MSYATDVLLYVSPGDKGIEPFLEKVRAKSRFESAPYPVNTGDFSGPNVFMGAVYAFGADYWSFACEENQELLDSVHWTSPGIVVLIVRTEGSHSEEVTQVYRPAFEERHSGYYNSELWAVQPQYVEERR